MDETFLPKPATAQDNAPLFVSLYIVLLAFFILLNTISKMDHKKMENAALSIASAFSLRPSLDVSPGPLADAGSSDHIAIFFDEMRTAPAGLVPLQKIEVETSGNVMRMTLPLDTLFIPENAEPSGTAAEFLERIASVLTRWQKGLRVEAEVVLSTPLESAAPTPMAQHDKNLAIMRAGFFARMLTERGIPAKHILPALRPDGRNLVTFLFTIRDIDASQLDLISPVKAEDEGGAP